MTRKYGFGLLAFTLLVGTAAAYADPQILNFQNTAPLSQAMTMGTVIDGSAANFQQEVLQSNVPVLVEFYATWCPHCSHMLPTLQSFAQRNAGKAKVVRIDIDKNSALANRYGVQGVPRFFMMKNGQVIDSIEGETNLGRLSAGLSKAFM